MHAPSKRTLSGVARLMTLTVQGRTRVHTASLFRGEGRGVKRISRVAVIADSLPRSGGGGGVLLAEGYMAGM